MRLSAELARALLAGARVARLATADADGRPHVVPVTFAVAEAAQAVYIAIDHKPKSTLDLKRLRNIEANPAVSLLADHYDEDWQALWWARADGTAEVTPPAAGAVGLLAAKYPQYASRRPAGPVIAISVTRWSGWAAGPAAVQDTPSAR